MVLGITAQTSVPGCGELQCPAVPTGDIPVAAWARLLVAGMMPRWCCGDCGHAGASWRVAVLLLFLPSASHLLSSPFSSSSLPLAGPHCLRLGPQPGTVFPSSGALCLHQRPPAILCLPLGWRLRPRLVLERKAFPRGRRVPGWPGPGVPPQRGRANNLGVPRGCSLWQ